jgi:hypothetical protein
VGDDPEVAAANAPERIGVLLSLEPATPAAAVYGRGSRAVLRYADAE